jgi:hypothetical protein
MMRAQLSTAAVVVVLAAGCGQAAASGPSATHATTTQATTATTGDDVESSTVTFADRRRSVRQYVKALQPVWREVARANVAAHHGVKIAGSGNFPALAAITRQVGRHLARAAALSRAITPPPGLERAHADLTRSFVVGTRMAVRLAVLYDHIGPDSQQTYNRQVRPLEKQAVKLGNRWYKPAVKAMLTFAVIPPDWVDHLYDWS